MRLPTPHLIRVFKSALQNPSWQELRTNWERLSVMAPRSLLDRMREEDITTVQQHSQLTTDVATYITETFQAQQQKSISTTSESAYTVDSLRVYDAFVWGFNSPFLWGIHESEIEQLYEESVQSSHAEIAVGTGLFLERVLLNRQQEQQLNELTLLDLNVNALVECETRLLSRHADSHHSSSTTLNRSIDTITKSLWDVWEEPPANLQYSFDSVAANFLLHCLPGSSLLDKQVVIEHCASLLRNSESVFFGSTILGQDLLLCNKEDEALPAAIQTTKAFNANGIFGNQGDCYTDLVKVLTNVFEDVEVWRSGHCAVWKAKKVKKLQSSKTGP